jgi:hypothetical protein
LDRQDFYQEQAESFRDFLEKNPDGDLLSLFNKWAFSKDFLPRDREEIWKKARSMRPRKKRMLTNGSDECVRISAVLEFLFEQDFNRLHRLIEKQKKACHT